MMTTTRPSDPTPDEIRLQLQRIFATKRFRSCARLRRFLSFIVERALDNVASDLKEYVIALEVFGKPITFDPRKDSDVRVAARQLRLKLDSYYLVDGWKDEVLIRLRAGGYVPVFYRNSEPRLRPETSASGSTVIVAESDTNSASRLLQYVEAVGLASAWVRSGAELLRHASGEPFPVVLTGGKLDDGMSTESICTQLGRDAAVLAVVSEDIEQDALARLAQSLPDAILTEPLCPEHLRAQVRLAVAKRELRTATQQLQAVAC